jgi:hypothetical protein
VPRAIRTQFIAPAVTVFGAMALVGFHAVIAPGVLADQLHRTSHFLAGGIGVIATFANMIVASLTFAVMIIVFALVALYFGMRH